MDFFEMFFWGHLGQPDPRCTDSATIGAVQFFGVAAGDGAIAVTAVRQQQPERFRVVSASTTEVARSSAQMLLNSSIAVLAER